MAFQIFIAIKGAKQGQFKAEAIGDRKDKWMPVTAFTMGVVTPFDAATGHASGRHQPRPLTITKAWGAASPQGLAANANNEVLNEVAIEFTKTGTDGKDAVYQTVTLTDAALMQIERFTGETQAAADAAGKPRPGATEMTELERWSFTFRQITVVDKDANTMFMDSWAAT